MDHVSVQALSQQRLYKIAFGLDIFTIIYNLAEGMLATWLGFEDESFTLFGFGVDSFIEVISGVGIGHMILRIWRHPASNRDPFERTALRVTGTAFYILTAGLALTGIYNLVTGHTPENTLWGVVISLVSIAIMWAMILAKTKVGKQLNSEAILADAECSRVCIYMSVILLVASGLHAFLHIPYTDVAGTLGLSYFSFREGRECFEKAKNNKLCGCSHD